MAYITLDDLKNYQGIDASDDDLLLQGFIDRAVAILEAPPPVGTGRKFEAYTATKYFFQADTDYRDLYFWREDLLAVTSLLNGDGATIDPSCYRLEPLNYLVKWKIHLLSDSDVYWYFPLTDSYITVEGTWGYSQTAPEPIQQATLRLASFLYKQKDSGQEIDRAVTSDGVTIQPARLPRDIYDIIIAYRRKL